MATSAALRREWPAQDEVVSASRDAVFARYLQLRAASKELHAGALSCVSRDAIWEHARRLGLARGKALICDDPDHIAYAFDLAIYTAPPGRMRAIDRYARQATFAAGSDEALVLAAMSAAAFSIFRVEHRHKVVGLVLTDAFGGGKVWLVDQGLELTACDRALFAARLFFVEGFAMTSGALAPLAASAVMEALREVPAARRGSPNIAAADRRFAQAIYRNFLANDGWRAVYRDPV